MRRTLLDLTAALFSLCSLMRSDQPGGDTELALGEAGRDWIICRELGLSTVFGVAFPGSSPDGSSGGGDSGFRSGSW